MALPLPTVGGPPLASFSPFPRSAPSGSSIPSGFGAGSGSVSEGTTTHLTGRPLLTPDEAMRLSPDRQVLLRPGKPPALALKLRHYTDREFVGLADG